MRHLYLRFYLALLVSLALFAVVAAMMWHRAGGPAERMAGTFNRMVSNALPPVTASRAEQQAALERLTAGLQVVAVLDGADGEVLAAVGGDVQASAPQMHHGAAWVINLPDGRRLRMQAAFPSSMSERFMVTLLGLLAVAVGVGAYPVVRQISSRLERLQRAVDLLGAGELSARVVVEGRDEVGQLAASFNRAATRIEELVAAHKTLLANASHELRTPLARIRLAVELLKTSADVRRREGLEQDIAELDALIDEILLASRLEAVPPAGGREQLDLLALAAEEAAHYDGVQVDGQSVPLLGEVRLLHRMVRNLLDNARRHGVPPVSVRVAMVAGCARLTVCDAGPGLPDAEFERIFEPFYRRAGGNDNIGAGLGLALVRQIARRHGGEARCERLVGGEVGFVVELPLPAG